MRLTEGMSCECLLGPRYDYGGYTLGLPELPLKGRQFCCFTYSFIANLCRPAGRFFGNLMREVAMFRGEAQIPS